jgi:hypothetical protein
MDRKRRIIRDGLILYFRIVEVLVCHPYGVFTPSSVHFPTASAVGYVVSSLRDFFCGEVESSECSRMG